MDVPSAEAPACAGMTAWGDGGVWRERGWLLAGPCPMATRMPSPWDPLLISPWEGEGMARGRGDGC